MYFDYCEKLVDGEVVVNPSVVIPTKEMSSGMYRDVDLSLYISIVASMNRKGESYITQDDLAHNIGVSKPTINKRINKLLKVEVNGKPVLLRELIHQKGYKKASRYTLPDCIHTVDTNDLVRVKYNSQDLLHFFMNTYKDKYQTEYKPNYARDCGALNRKIIGEYEQEHIEEVVAFAINNYNLWGNKAYPRPTVPMICSWLFQKAEDRLRDKKNPKGVAKPQTVQEQQKQDDISRRYF